MLGFSLIELLIVIAIVGVLAAIAWMGSRGLLERGRVNEALASIELRANEARLEAKRSDGAVEFRMFEGRVEIAPVAGANRPFALGRSVTLDWDAGSEPQVLLFEPPFGTWGGEELVIRVRSGRALATVSFVGVLARPVVTR